MKTVQQVINKSARLAGVLDPYQTLTANDAEDYLEALNDLVAELRNSGVELGLSTLALSDNFTIDEADYQAMQYLLAVAIREENRLPPDQLLYSKAEMYKSELMAIYYQVAESKIPLSLVYRRNNSAYDIESE